MATLPQYNSKRNIEAGLSSPIRKEAGFSQQLTQQITGVLGEINQKMMEAKDTMQYTEAKTKYSVAVADIMSRVSQDPDFNNSESYLKELAEAKKNSLVGIKNRSLSEKLSADLGFNNQISSIKINDDFFRKELVHNKNSLKVGVNTLLQQSLSADTTAERSEKELELSDLLSMNVDKNTITQFESDEMLYEARKNVAMFDAQYNPDRFLANKKDYGLNANDMASVGATAEKSKKTQEKEMEALQKKDQEQNVVNFTKAFFGGELPNISINDIQKRIDTGQLPVDFGNAFIEAITTPKLTQVEIAEDQFLTVINQYLAADNERGVINVLTEALKKTGKTRQDELNAVMQFAVANMKEEKRGILQNAMSRIMEVQEYSPAGMAVKSVMSFIKNINNGDDPIKAKQKAEFGVAMEVNPSLMSLSDNGTIMQDPVTGVRKRVFKDGRIEDVK